MDKQAFEFLTLHVGAIARLADARRCTLSQNERGDSGVDALAGSVHAGLELAYAKRAERRERLADAFMRADLASMEAAIATLPLDRAPLTGRMRADDLQRWVELHESGHAGFGRAVAELRKLDALLPDAEQAG